MQILFCHLDVKHNNLCYVVEGFREGILNLKFKEMSIDISRTDLESFINFEDRLNNF